MTQLVEKAVFGFFDKLLTFSISSKKFLTARESGGSPVSVWLRPKASGLPPAAPTPFHTFPPWLILRGATFLTVFFIIIPPFVRDGNERPGISGEM